MLTKLYILFFKIINAEKTKKILNSIGKFFSKILKSKLLLTAILLLIILEVMFWGFNHKISINISNSLPFKMFLVDMRQSSIDKIKNGDYLQFRNSNTHYYSGKNITKMVLAIGGDTLEINQYKNPSENIQATIKFNGYTLEVKDYTALGTKIHTNNLEIIPQDQYFVYATHKNSFDSRYKEFGLIDKKEVIGVAKPLF